MDSDSSRLIAKRYALVRALGRGGMGVVWEGRDTLLNRQCAVKEVVLPAGLPQADRERQLVRTAREARTAAQLNHPSVVAVYDVVEEEGRPWIIMELVRAPSVEEVVATMGALPVRQAADVGRQVLSALVAAHAQGILHRDVKPSNVLLADDGRAVLTDFGIATTEDEAPVTRTGILIGTPAFMAPERAAGGSAEAASDLWSLGVTLYVAVEGHSPFHRSNALATLSAVMHAEPAPLARAGVLAPVLLGLLRKNPAERMTVEEAEQRLTAIIRGIGPEPTGPVPLAEVDDSGAIPAQAVPGRRRQPLLALGVGALVTALVTGGAAWWSHRPAETSGPQVRPPAVVHTPEQSAPASPPPASTGPERGTGREAGAEHEGTTGRESGTRREARDPRRGGSPPTRESARQDTAAPTQKKKPENPAKSPGPDRSSPPERDEDAPGQVEPSGGGARAQHFHTWD